MRSIVLSVALATTLITGATIAAVPKNLAYQSGNLSADELAAQNYFVNHFYAFDNYGIGKKGKDITSFVLRPKGSNPLTLTIERFLNNNTTKAGVKSRDLAVFRSGKLKDTAFLITDYKDDNKSQSYEIFVPSIRKVRRFAEPARDDAYGGSDFTFGDVTLRKPRHETHELLGKVTMSGCLGMMQDVKRNKYTKNSKFEPDCSVDGKEVYKLKSTTKDTNWWYDYRISYIDPKSFVDYRTEYFKDGKQVKLIDRSWASANLDDPRASYWFYWYGKNFTTGHETLAFIPQSVLKVNHKYKVKNLWSAKTLRKMPRNIR